MEFADQLPTTPGLYRHRWIDTKGKMQEHTLFVGYTNFMYPRLQGDEPTPCARKKLRCCPPEENLHSERLTPMEWGGWWSGPIDQSKESG